MRSARPPYAATGNPPPMTLPRVVRSGLTPKRSGAPPGAIRNPVITSSKISSAPCASASRRNAGRNPGSGGMNPALPTTGSTMMAAMRGPRSAINCSTAATSLYGATKVSSASAAGTPGEFGRPSVATPEPARTRKESAWPW